MAPTLDLTRTHWQQGLSSVQCLDLRLLINAEDHGAIWWIQIEPHDVPNFVNKQRIFRKLERFTPVRLQCKSPPDAANRAPTEAALFSQRPRAPVSRVSRLRLQRHGQHLLHFHIAKLARCTRTWFIQQSVQPLVQETRPPLADR